MRTQVHGITYPWGQHFTYLCILVTYLDTDIITDGLEVGKTVWKCSIRTQLVIGCTDSENASTCLNHDFGILCLSKFHGSHTLGDSIIHISLILVAFIHVHAYIYLYIYIYILTKQRCPTGAADAVLFLATKAVQPKGPLHMPPESWR